MEAPSSTPKVYSSSVTSTSASPHSSHNLSAFLKIKIISWSQETGLPAMVRVHVGGKMFNLHKLPLSSKSGYFKRLLLQQTTDHIITLPSTFPGGVDTFEMIALFIYGTSNFIDTFNIAPIRCAAQFLDMTSDIDNLCDRADLYLNQVVLQSWDDTLVILQRCQSLLPWAEELLIVSRCVESLAFMACMEVLDPERKMEHPSLSLDALVEAAGRPWNCEKVKMMVCEDHWIKDLIGLPFRFFRRVIGSLRRQGMKEKYVSPIVVFYGNKWVLSKKKTRQFWECLCSSGEEVNNSNNCDVDEDDGTRRNTLEILQGVVDLLLPCGEKGGTTTRGTPVGFLFSMIGRSLELGMERKNTSRLQEQIVALLPSAQVDDFLIPRDSLANNSSAELDTIRSIFSKFVSTDMDTTTSSHSKVENCSNVGELWDAYLAQIASDPTMELQLFLDLIETVPLSYRQTHDHLYRAITVFLKAHRDLSQEERNSVCKYLRCQKLSQETCIEAVLNDLMPLRVVVQAVFVQQLHTQQAFRACSESFRYTHCSDLFSGSISSSRHFNFHSQPLGSETPFVDQAESERGSAQQSLSYLIEKELSMGEKPGVSAEGTEYDQSTSFRIQTLEEELWSLKKSLQLKTLASMNNVSVYDESRTRSFRASGLMGGRSMSKRRKPLAQVGTGCIGSVTFTSQRRYGARIWRVFRRVIWFGKGKPKSKRSPTSTLWPRS